MQSLDKNYINKLKLPHTDALVMLNGIYQEKLSDKCEKLILSEQTFKIPKNTKIEKPIHLLLLASQDYSHTINIIAEENSCFTLIEEYAGLTSHGYASNIRINITARKNSEIIYYKLQTENSISTHCAQTIIKQEQNSKISSGFVGKGAKLSQDSLLVELTEKNAIYNAIGIIALHESQTLNYKICIKHLAPSCSSNVLFKGLINDKATGNFDCLVVVHPNAIKTETHVTNKNLLLSELATMNTAPALEVYSDDIICTHGATVGQLDQEALFYLRSRGIAENKAEQLLTTAFVQEIIDQFDAFCQPKITLDTAYEH
ncbi:MAG: SufD family Fe-S cluster assembly protein [bacterium]